MNLNIILDADYIYKKLSDGKEELINSFFTFIKNQTKIKILQDNEKNILKKIIKHQKIADQNIKETEIFLSALINGTNKFEFSINENYDDKLEDFITNIVKKNYPLQMIITDKKIDLSVETYLIEDLDKIIKTIKKFSEKHIITDNEKILSKKDETNVVSFEDYEEILLNTFWCSSKITIIGKEFFDGSVFSGGKEFNKKVYAKGLDFLTNIFNKIEKFTGNKPEIEIITGMPGKPKKMENWRKNSKKLTDELYEILEKIDTNIKLKIVKWDIGDEITVGEGHGRRIYSDYGGFDTGFMPFDLFTNELRFKDTSFHWITEKEHINPLLLMNILAERPHKSI